MAHHGRKTDGHAHVLNDKNLDLRVLKARKGSFLCLSSIACGVLFGGALLLSVSAQAQSDPVYASSNAGQTEIRIQQLETQIRELTGKVEEQVYELNSLKQKIRFLEDGVSQVGSNAPQVLSPSSGQMNAGQMGASQIGQPSMGNPLGIDFNAQQLRGMQTKTVIAGNTDATAQYEQAYANLKNAKYEEAQAGFDNFLSVHSDHILAANAKYWLGETYYVRGNYKKAARVFAEGFQTYPESAKAPDILLKLGLTLKALGKTDDACVALEQVPVKFPVGNDDVLRRASQERSALSCDV